VLDKCTVEDCLFAAETVSAKTVSAAKSNKERLTLPKGPSSREALDLGPTLLMPLQLAAD